MEKENNIPASGLAGLRAHWKDDMLSGFMVSLIALPLCLGIAIASGVPPMAGLTSAIIGGLFMSRITGSHITISGPAAGLIVVTLGAVESLGGGDPLAGYKYALAAIVVAGAIQAILGLLKVGKLGDFFPSAAVHGMLAAIGVIIIVKQLFVALGTKAESGGHGLFDVMAQIPDAVLNMNPEIALIAMTSFFILAVHPHIKLKIIRMIPAPMWVLVFAIPFSHLFDLFHEHSYNLVGHTYELGPKYLVHLPDKISEGIVFPDFGLSMTGAFWIAVISICLVSSIESLLSAAAVDTLDPYKRKSNLDRDMSVMGGGSALSGFLGGLPMISEIVRSSANIGNGGKTQWANFFHGGFLLLFLLFGKPIIEQIPLAALAAMLIHVGFRLASPAEFKHVWEIGKSQFLVFTITLVTVLATDLIIGIATGILTQLVIHVIYGAPLKYLFRNKINYDENGDSGVIKLEASAIFSNYLSVKTEIERHADKQKLVIDFDKVNLLDHSFREHVHELQTEWSESGKEMSFVNDEHLVSVSNHPLAAKFSVNLEHLGIVKFNEKQNRIQEYADSIGMDYYPIKSMSTNQYQGFSFNLKGKVKYTENMISGSIDGHWVVYNEVILDTSLETKSNDLKIPTALIYLGVESPKFTLEKEGFIDKLKAYAGYDDIDFEDYPNFSDKFLLMGENEESIRKFFKPELIELIENYPYYHIESKGNVILIHSFNNKTGEQEMKNLLELVKNFIEKCS
ncbi:MAG: SulP family inorganic anion transporter [Reichenbachiella sp.]|uniref:SulP family inorganic anion transporter n=1 Tax=Reichenbachiella sp. TaxID=2184521 RepID=UPI003297D54D